MTIIPERRPPHTRVCVCLGGGGGLKHLCDQIGQDLLDTGCTFRQFQDKLAAATAAAASLVV